MKQGETIGYYRARGGERSVYVTVLYDKDDLRRVNVIQNYEPAYIKAAKDVESINADNLV